MDKYKLIEQSGYIQHIKQNVPNRKGHVNNSRELNRQNSSHSEPHAVNRSKGGVDLRN
jgi:hypothetical protein